MLDIPFQVILPNIDETLTSSVDTEDIPELLAREKVSAVIHSLPSQQEIQWVLGADTVIVKNGRIFGKPQSADEAAEFLKEFQGGSHTVITAVVLYNGNGELTKAVNVKANAWSKTEVDNIARRQDKSHVRADDR